MVEVTPPILRRKNGFLSTKTRFLACGEKFEVARTSALHWHTHPVRWGALPKMHPSRIGYVTGHERYSLS